MDAYRKEYKCPTCNTKILFIKEPKGHFSKIINGGKAIRIHLDEDN